MVTNAQIVEILSAVILWLFAMASIVTTYEIHIRRGGQVVTSRTVGALMRSMAVRQSQYLRKGSTMNLSEIKKTIITVLGLIISVGGPILNYGTGLLPANVVLAVSSVVAVATAVLTYLVPNEAASAERAAGRSVRVKGQKPVKAA